MSSEKYIGLDVHQATISVAILDSAGKLVMEAILETKSATILQFIHGLRGGLRVTFEEGTWASWLYDLLKPHVSDFVDQTTAGILRKLFGEIREHLRCHFRPQRIEVFI